MVSCQLAKILNWWMYDYLLWKPFQQTVYKEQACKVWVRATSTGAGVNFEPYYGSSTRITIRWFGQGPKFVLDLIDKAQSVTKFRDLWQYLDVHTTPQRAVKIGHGWHLHCLPK